MEEKNIVILTIAGILGILGLVSIMNMGALAKYNYITIQNLSNKTTEGWVEYIDNVYNNTNRLTISNTLVKFSMVNYTTREKELPKGITNLTWFNGTHILTDRAGNSFLYRWRYSAEPQGVNAYCEAFYNINGTVGQLPMRLITFPKGNGIEQTGTFTNIEYTLNTWYENGAEIQIICPIADVQFWDIEFTIERNYKGRGIY